MPNKTMPTRSGGAVRTAPQNDEDDVVATNEGAEDRSGSAEERLGSREAMFAAIDAKRNAAVQQDIDYAFETGDPAAAQAEAARRTRQAIKDKEASANAEAQSAADDAPANAQDNGAAGEDEGAETDDGAASTNLPSEVVMSGGKAMLKLKVDGKERLVPLDTAIAQLQKGGAAEVRLQQAAELRKQLDVREASLNAREAAQKSQPFVPPANADADLDVEAQAVVDSLLTDDPKVAAAKLKGVLVKVRQAAPPSIDENTLIGKAVQATRQTLAVDAHNRSLQTGLTKFQQEYSEIAKDPKLERMADGMTDTIAAEHPEWSPEQVMLEAGRQTREWVESLTGVKLGKTTPAAPDLAADRRDRKVGLRPLPQQRAGRQVSAKPAEQVETPQSIVAEMRKARGQV